MAQIVSYWCKIPSILLEGYINTFIDCPRNFPHNHIVPEIGDTVTFCHRRSDRTRQQGIAILVDGVFVGWIRRSNLQIVRVRIGGNVALSSVVVSRELRVWASQGGDNFRGNIEIEE